MRPHRVVHVHQACVGESPSLAVGGGKTVVDVGLERTRKPASRSNGLGRGHGRERPVPRVCMVCQVSFSANGSATFALA